MVEDISSVTDYNTPACLRLDSSNFVLIFKIMGRNAKFLQKTNDTSNNILLIGNSLVGVICSNNVDFLALNSE